LSLDTSKIYSVAVQAFDSLDATMPAFQVGLEWLPDRGAYAALWNSCPAPTSLLLSPTEPGTLTLSFELPPAPFGKATSNALWYQEISTFSVLPRLGRVLPRPEALVPSCVPRSALQVSRYDLTATNCLRDHCQVRLSSDPAFLSDVLVVVIDADSSLSVAGSTPPRAEISMRGLTEGEAFYAVVSATHSFVGVESERSSQAVVIGIPGAPTITAVWGGMAGGAYIEVAFSAPVKTEGAPIESYMIVLTSDSFEISPARDATAQVTSPRGWVQSARLTGVFLKIALLPYHALWLYLLLTSSIHAQVLMSRDVSHSTFIEKITSHRLNVTGEEWTGFDQVLLCKPLSAH
jgi:hypothetical protein